ncbi:DUF6191 domain-containing protein [Kitasatospora aureofaciens]|uniref:DUF6191 domain-containing protein n=1 Tax=Kitasatospora aureofaciens TaxID=1894 RepID=UPI001C45B3FB|nr:DUF6191 domain-containing protein [Kitasatospora aureofaciens]MBV6697188.1 hypothetical protein [Kitasatospora aureofaciens]
MGMIVGSAAVVAAIVGLVLLAVWQIRDETTPRRRSGTGGGFGLSAAGLEELHAMFSSGKQIQIEQKRVQLTLRDDAEAGAPPHFGVDLEAGVAVLRNMPKAQPAEGIPDRLPDGDGRGQAPQVREQSTSR